MKSSNPDYWIKNLDLTAHPEGGFYRSTFRSKEQVTDSELTIGFSGRRLLYTSIYF